MTYLAITALTLGRVVDEDNLVLGFTFLTFAALGFVILYHMSGLAAAGRIAVLNLRELEIELGLVNTVDRRTGISSPLRMAVLGTVLVSLNLASYFIAKSLSESLRSC